MSALIDGSGTVTTEDAGTAGGAVGRDGRNAGEMMASLRLLPQRAAFVDAYLTNGCDHIAAYQAAFGRDISRKVAATNGRKLLNHAEIQRIILGAVDRQQADMFVKHGLDASRILKELMDIAFNRFGKAADRIRALELLGKKYGLWLDKTELSGGLNLTGNLGDTLERARARAAGFSHVVNGLSVDVLPCLPVSRSDEGES